jgi:DHA3 family macrolide efflux protein-like MFS transporter
MNIRNGILKERDFMILWIGQFISKAGNALYDIAAMWYVLEKTGSTTRMGITLVCACLPAITVGPAAGIVADRFDRKRIIIVTDTIQGLIMGAMASLMYFNMLKISQMYLLSALMSAVSAFFSPAISSSIPVIVKEENLINANNLSKFADNLCNIFGPVLGGALIAVTGIPGLVIFNAISFIAAAVFESFIHIPRCCSYGTAKLNFKRDIKEGFLYAVKNKKLLQFIIVGGFIINFFLAPLSIIFPVLSTKSLGAGSRGYGMLMSSIAIGSIIMTLLIPIISKKLSYYMMTFLGLVLEGVFLVMIGFSKNIYFAVVSTGLLGTAVCTCSVSLTTVFQKLIPNEMMGRVSSMTSIISQSTVPLGIFLGGIILEKVSPSMMLIVSGIIVAISGFTTINTAKESPSKVTAKESEI